MNLLVTLPSPHPKASAHPITLEMLRTKEHAPTPYPFVVFTFRLAIESTKEFGDASIPMAHHDRYQSNPNYVMVVK